MLFIEGVLDVLKGCYLTVRSRPVGIFELYEIRPTIHVSS